MQSSGAMLGGRLLFALYALVLSLLACAHPSAAPVAKTALADGGQTPPKGLFLYRVERNGHASHLLGTIHLGFGFDEVLTPAGEAAFNSAQRVITETDLADDPASRLVQAALLPPGQTLNALIDAKTWQALEARLAGQIPSPVLAQMKPWLPAVLLGISELKEAFDVLRPGKSERMMDVELMARAEKAKKAQQHLETVDEQIAVFDGISLEEQVSELQNALEENSREQSYALVKAFESGDEAQLCAALFDAEQMKMAPGFYQAVLFARNARWLPVVEAALAQGNAFIAVGAAHLLGEHGLLQELRNRGYQVARVY
jgi:uncharacterized protein YbaP (TraB family)